jgi:AcrR family transcriptional regulator
MAERKRPRRTRERILETSLALFNARGEPHITTADIAQEMNISPGNLYYHFRSKDEIVGELFAAFEHDARPLFFDPEGRPADVEDLWLFVHLLLERMHAYRFVYRDLVDLASRHRRMAAGLATLLSEGEATLRGLFAGLRAAGELRATDDEIETLAGTAMLILTHSPAHERLRAGVSVRGDAPDPAGAARQILMLVAPYLTGDARALVERISAQYATARQGEHA